MDIGLVVGKARGVRRWTKSIVGDHQISCHNFHLCVHLLYYLSVGCAGISLQVTKVTSGVLKTEASLMTLCHFTASADLQQIIMAELIHTVVVPVGTSKKRVHIVKMKQSKSLCFYQCSSAMSCVPKLQYVNRCLSGLLNFYHSDTTILFKCSLYNLKCDV